VSGAEKARLNIPPRDVEQYARNVAKQVVCELKFPALLDLETSPPRALQAALRHEYPHYDVGWNVSLDPGSTSPRHEPRYLFKDREKVWTLALRPSSMSLETTRYVRFSDFLERLKGIIAATSKHLDLVFFTRVGLRYINAIPVRQSSLSGWVNPVLVSAVSERRLGWMVECFQELRGYALHGLFSLRHGMTPNSEGEGDYLIDTDFYRETVEIGDAAHVLTQLNQESYGLFEWCIGDTARRYMRGEDVHVPT
jgi:uncharacterized protein (TIGR04255 family)